MARSARLPVSGKAVGSTVWSVHAPSQCPNEEARCRAPPFASESEREPLPPAADTSVVATVRLLQAMHSGLRVLGPVVDRRPPRGAKSPGAPIRAIASHLASIPPPSLRGDHPLPVLSSTIHQRSHRCRSCRLPIACCPASTDSASVIGSSPLGITATSEATVTALHSCIGTDSPCKVWGKAFGPASNRGRY